LRCEGQVATSNTTFLDPEKVAFWEGKWDPENFREIWKVGEILSRWWQLKYVSNSSLFGEMIQFDEHIFQMGWFNHQLVIIWPDTVVGRLWATWPAEQGILSEMLVPGSYPPAAIPEERFSLSA